MALKKTTTTKTTTTGPQTEVQFTRRSVLRIESCDNGVVVIDPENGQLHVFNASAAFLLAECEGVSRQTLIDRVAKSHGVSADTIAGDVDDFLMNSEKRGIIHRTKNVLTRSPATK